MITNMYTYWHNIDSSIYICTCACTFTKNICIQFLSYFVFIICFVEFLRLIRSINICILVNFIYIHINVQAFADTSIQEYLEII